MAAAGAADDPLSFDPLSFDRGPSKPPLLETTIGANFAATAAKYAQRDALVDVAAGRCWNYAELLVSVRQLATG
ncbi:MAG: fatty-acyl-CoA synthase, partial [Mycobacterium sp.]|nr:fatty-acyl-CoA synthase [Mycobacterium sp.]